MFNVSETKNQLINNLQRKIAFSLGKKNPTHTKTVSFSWFAPTFIILQKIHKNCNPNNFGAWMVRRLVQVQMMEPNFQ